MLEECSLKLYVHGALDKLGHHSVTKNVQVIPRNNTLSSNKRIEHSYLIYPIAFF